MWRYTENENNEGICMAVSSFMFLALQISTEEQEAFLDEANIEFM
jgi:hypothetical protein